MGRRIVLWRHGRTQWNVLGRTQGHTDIPLDTVGLRQVRRAAAELCRLGPTAIVSSDLTRARQTAQELAERVGLEIEVDARLREMCFGAWEGLTWEQAKERFGMDAMIARAHGDSSGIPGAESSAHLGDRVAEALADHVSSLPEDGVLVVATHGGSIRAGVGRFLGLPEQRWGVFATLANASWTVLEEQSDPLQPPWRLVGWNADSLPKPVLADPS